jgi:hypothetical protein
MHQRNTTEHLAGLPVSRAHARYLSYSKPFRSVPCIATERFGTLQQIARAPSRRATTATTRTWFATCTPTRRKANATRRERQPATHRKAACDRIGKATRRAMPGSFPSTSQPRAASTRNSPSCEFLAGLIARFSPACLPCHGSFLGTGRLRAASTRDLHSSRIFPVVNGG